MKKIAILCSGQGSNAENIYSFFANGNRVSVELVIYDRRDAPVAERMREHGVDTLYLPAEVWTSRPEEIVTLLKERDIDLVVLAGFLRVVPPAVTSAYNKRIINIHPSLLPAYRGKGMYGSNVHQAVFEAGEKETGATVHYVTDNVDEGKIILQETVEITPEDTPASIEEKVRQLEFSLYPKAIIKALSDLPEDESKPLPGEEWAETLGVNYDPSKLPPAYPGAVPPPLPNAQPQFNPAPHASAPQPQPFASYHAAAQSPDSPKMPPAYLVWSVVMTVLCCLPAGVVAIIYSSKVSSRFYAGDIEGANRASERAQIWIIVSFVLGVLSNTLYLPLALAI